MMKQIKETPKIIGQRTSCLKTGKNSKYLCKNKMDFTFSGLMIKSHAGDPAIPRGLTPKETQALCAGASTPQRPSCKSDLSVHR